MIDFDVIKSNQSIVIIINLKVNVLKFAISIKYFNIYDSVYVIACAITIDVVKH